VIAIPTVAVLVAVGLVQTVRLARRLLAFDRRWGDAVLALVGVALVGGSLRFYFVEFTPQRRYGSSNGETATMIGHYLRGQAPGTQVYFLGAPRIYWGFGTMDFLAPQVDGHDIEEPLTGPPDAPDTGRSRVFVFLPERSAGVEWVQQAFPGGQEREFQDDRGKLRFIAYEVSP